MRKKIRDAVFYIIVGFYVILMLQIFFRILWIIMGDHMPTRNYNLIPFHTIWEYISGMSLTLALLNVLGNIVGFVPFGLYIQVIKKDKSFAKSFIIVLATSVLIELTQYIFAVGATDIDDVILNVFGGTIGILTYKILLKLLQDEDKTKTFITIASIIIGVPLTYLFLI